MKLKIDLLRNVKKIFKVKSVNKIPTPAKEKENTKWVYKARPVNEFYHRWNIKSSTDGRRVYVLVRNGHDKFTCSCKGWIYNRHCKHIEAKRAALGLK